MDQLDIRLPLGLLFMTLGLTLVVYGLFSGPEIYVVHSLGKNVNLIWGAVFTLFGAVAFWLSPRRR